QPRGEIQVRISDTRIEFVFEFVVQRSGRGIPAQPELLDEIESLGVRGKSKECNALCRRDDVHNVLIQPFLKRIRNRRLRLRMSRQDNAEADDCNSAQHWHKNRRLRFGKTQYASNSFHQTSSTSSHNNLPLV